MFVAHGLLQLCPHRSAMAAMCRASLGRQMNTAIPAAPVLSSQTHAPVLSSQTHPKRKCDGPPRLDLLTAGVVKNYFEEGRSLTRSLFGAARDTSVLYKSPDPLRRPLIFYFGHNDAFNLTKLQDAGLCGAVNKELEALLDRGVWELEGDDGKPADRFDWPPFTEVQQYVRLAKERVHNVIECAEWNVPITWDSPLWSIMMILEHERIHFETSSVLFRQLPARYLVKPPNWAYAPTRAASPGEAPSNSLVKIDACHLTLGRQRADPYYGWCNEYGSLCVSVPDFLCTTYLVSNAEFFPFLCAGGYQGKDWWTPDGWKWRQTTRALHPLSWVPIDLGDAAEDLGLQQMLCHEDTHCLYRYRTTFEIVDMPWDWPVEVNHYEAEAFCRWKSQCEGLQYKLPTEAQFHAMRGVCNGDGVGSVPSECLHANLGMQWGSPTPVDMHKTCATGIHDAVGNVWQLTSTEFKALPGWKPHKFYPDFSEPHFTPHNIMALGGSWASTGEQMSEHYRLWWLRHFYQHMGFRMVVER
jgi:5-histidylcysteine sulfoxide synthase